MQVAFQKGLRGKEEGAREGVSAGRIRLHAVPVDEVPAVASVMSGDRNGGVEWPGVLSRSLVRLDEEMGRMFCLGLSLGNQMRSSSFGSFICWPQSHVFLLPSLPNRRALTARGALGFGNAVPKYRAVIIWSSVPRPEQHLYSEFTTKTNRPACHHPFSG